MRSSHLLTAIALCALGCHAAPLGGRGLDATPLSDAASVFDTASAPDTASVLDGDSDSIALTVPAGATIVASGQAWPAYLALDDGNVYWLNLGIYDSPGPKVWWWNGTQIMKCPKTGCPQGPTTLVSGRLLTYGSTLLNIVTDGQYVFWSDDGYEESIGTSEIGIGLFRCSVAGCDNTPEVLDDNRARGLAVAGGSLYVTHAYSAAIEACPTSGCASPANLLWSDEPWSTNTETIAVAADATDVYWTTRGMGARD